MAGWSTTYRFEGANRASGSARVRHLCRDVEQQAGLTRDHGNRQIVKERTHLNETFSLRKEADGRLTRVPIGSVDEVFDRWDARLATVQNYRVDKKTGKKTPVKIRKDASQVVELLFQLDPEMTGPVEGMSPEKKSEVQRLHQEFLQFVMDKYGEQNIVMVAEHWDETNPHISVIATPITPDGELNAKAFSTGKKAPTRAESRKAYAKQHDDLRKRLQSAGYEATFDRVSEGAKNMPLANFKRAAQRATEVERERLDDQTAETRMEGFKAKGLQQKFERQTAELEEREKEVAEARSELSSQVKDVVLDLTELDEALWCLNHPAEPSPRDRDELANYLARHGQEHDVQFAMSQVKRRVNLLVEDTDEVIDKAQTVLDELTPLLDRLPEKDSVKVREGAATLAPLLATRSRKDKTAGHSPAD